MDKNIKKLREETKERERERGRERERERGGEMKSYHIHILWVLQHLSQSKIGNLGDVAIVYENIASCQIIV